MFFLPGVLCDLFHGRFFGRFFLFCALRTAFAVQQFVRCHAVPPPQFHQQRKIRHGAGGLPPADRAGVDPQLFRQLLLRQATFLAQLF